MRNKSNGLVGNLEKSDFQIFEDGKQQEIKYFTRETDLPLTIGLLVDTSESQERLLDIERRAAYQFFSKVLRKKDLAFLMQFGAEAELLQDDTNSPRLLQDGLESTAAERARAAACIRAGADAAEPGGHDPVRRGVSGREREAEGRSGPQDHRGDHRRRRHGSKISQRQVDRGRAEGRRDHLQHRL